MTRLLALWIMALGSRLGSCLGSGGHKLLGERIIRDGVARGPGLGDLTAFIPLPSATVGVTLWSPLTLAASLSASPHISRPKSSPGRWASHALYSADLRTASCIPPPYCHFYHLQIIKLPEKYISSPRFVSGAKTFWNPYTWLGFGIERHE